MRRGYQGLRAMVVLIVWEDRACCRGSWLGGVAVGLGRTGWARGALLRRGRGPEVDAALWQDAPDDHGVTARLAVGSTAWSQALPGERVESAANGAEGVSFTEDEGSGALRTAIVVAPSRLGWLESEGWLECVGRHGLTRTRVSLRYYAIIEHAFVFRKSGGCSASIPESKGGERLWFAVVRRRGCTRSASDRSSGSAAQRAKRQIQGSGTGYGPVERERNRKDQLVRTNRAEP